MEYCIIKMISPLISEQCSVEFGIFSAQAQIRKLQPKTNNLSFPSFPPKSQKKSSSY